MKKKLEFIGKVVVMSVILLVFYFVWTGTTDVGNLTIVGILALITSLLVTNLAGIPKLTPKKVAYAIWYVFYLLWEITKSNFDVAKRVIQPRIPINPGIVAVKTKLKSPAGRMILANSITLTPGTLTVEIEDDTFYIHWIDVADVNEEAATKEIVAGFEKYLEVIFG